MNRYLVPLVAVMLLIIFLVIGLRQGDPHALPSPFIGNQLAGHAPGSVALDRATG